MHFHKCFGSVGGGGGGGGDQDKDLGRQYSAEDVTALKLPILRSIQFMQQ